jgi:hypothetical protein
MGGGVCAPPLAGSRWKALSAAERRPWEEKANEEKQRLATTTAAAAAGQARGRNQPPLLQSAAAMGSRKRPAMATADSVLQAVQQLPPTILCDVARTEQHVARFEDQARLAAEQQATCAFGLLYATAAGLQSSFSLDAKAAQKSRASSCCGLLLLLQLEGPDQPTPCFLPLLGDCAARAADGGGGGGGLASSYEPQRVRRCVAAARSLLESEDLISVSWDCQTSFRHLGDLMMPAPRRAVRPLYPRPCVVPPVAAFDDAICIHNGGE